MRSTRFLALSLAVLAAVTAAIVPAWAGEHRAYLALSSEPRLPGCDAASVRSAVSGALARAHRDYRNGRTILSVDLVRETAYRINGISPLARRYCSAQAGLSDGSTRTVHYMVEEHAGFVGVSWNVEACLSPLDKWHVYGAHCSTVRPR